MATTLMKIPNKQKQKYLISKEIDEFFTGISNAFNFFIDYFKAVVSPPFEFAEIGRQCYQIGCKSLSLITLTGFVVGIVFTQQSRPSLVTFGASSWLPSLIGIAIIRALAPLLTAIVCAGKIGSGIGAELGAMKVSEQIDAMETSATDPFKFLVVSRVTASTLMTPLLMIYTAFVGVIGAYFNVSANEHTSFVTFKTNVFQEISFLDCASSLIRAAVYGFTIGMVSCYQGYVTTQGTAGVGKAANSAVVIAMYLIFIQEEIIVQVVNWIR
jgi:phospholipid/cholesterol/gamma-HCH transport system permease protein